MFFIIGAIVVLASVFGSYSVHGNLWVLWQPLEFVIILGAAVGAFLIANPMRIVMGAATSFGLVFGGPKYNRKAYEELLGVLYSVFKLAKSKGDLALESHVEKPEESSLFANFPTFHKNHHAVEFLCDYLRLLTLGASNPHELEAVMDKELDIHHADDHQIAAALQTMADALPALGIVAAVLGVIVTMASITEPPEVLGNLIGAALVGTFSGILMSYGFVAPIASALDKAFTSDATYLLCIKAGILGHMQGYAPQVSVEFARKTLNPSMRPTFLQVEEMVNALPQAA